MGNNSSTFLLGGLGVAFLLATSACTINVPPASSGSGNQQAGGIQPDPVPHQPQPAPRKPGLAERFKMFGGGNTDAQNKAIIEASRRDRTAPRSTADMTREEIRNRSNVTSRPTNESSRRLVNERIVPEPKKSPTRNSKPWEILLGKPPVVPNF